MAMPNTLCSSLASSRLLHPRDLDSGPLPSPLVHGIASSVEERRRRTHPHQLPPPPPHHHSGFLLPPCRALSTETSRRSPPLDHHPSSPFEESKEHPFVESNTSRGSAGGVPVFVMLPLDSVTHDHHVNRRRATEASFAALKSAGVKGIMMDVWWGIVEREHPQRYNWSGYKELIGMAKRHGLKVQAVMSFHQCGGNVGDSCSIPLPRWVIEEMERNPDLAYTDKHGRRNYEYVSLGCDTLPVLKGRTPVQVYSDYMRSFRDTFKDILGDVIVEIQVGMGPAGELRYPSYPESHGTWRFPGIGEFQCYDKYMLANLRATAGRVGKKEWGYGGPCDSGCYNNWPEETNFFRSGGGWATPYGEFFLSWYSGMLLAHGERILSAAEGLFCGTGAKLSGKVAGIHWHYGTRSHAAELTAGYYNSQRRDGYLPIARMFGRHGVVLNFTCIEMRNMEQPAEADSSPEDLVRQVAYASWKAGIPIAGENALPRLDQDAHRQVVKTSRLSFLQDHHHHHNHHHQHYPFLQEEPMCAFTFLRMNEKLFQTDNWRHFVPFVTQMAEGRTYHEWEEEEQHRNNLSYIHASTPLMQEAAHALAYN